MRTNHENMSDHYHVTFLLVDRASGSSSSITTQTSGVRRHPGGNIYWMDVGLLSAILILPEWTGVKVQSLEPPSLSDEAELETERLVRWSTALCDTAHPSSN